MNTELLFKLYAIHSESGNEKKMRRFLRKYIKENCGEVTMVTDSKGNLLCTKGESETYPCLASHMDQVQRDHSKDFDVVCNGDRCFGFSWKLMEMQGLGADDKNGIFICLECLKTFDVLKVAFFVGEEVGCVGSGDVSLNFFKDCRFIIEPDRRGGNDLITSMFCGQVCSKKFIEDIKADEYGYREERGSVTDVGELMDRGVGISCLNLSCGYYNPHTDEEFTVLSELENCLEFVMHVIRDCREVYPFEGGYGSYGYNYGYKYGNYGNYGSYGQQVGHYSALIEKLAKGAKGSEQMETDARFDAAYEKYLNDGSYDADYEIMQMYLDWDRNMSFEDIYNTYGYDFYAPMNYDVDTSFALLELVYEDVKSSLPVYSHDDFWDDESETEPKESNIVELKAS